MKDINDDQVKNVLNSLTADQRGFVQAVTEMKVQNKVYERQLVELKRAYDELWKVWIVLLHAQPGNVLRIHESQFLSFNEEYRVDRTFDKEKREVVLRLLTVHDEPTVDPSNN